MGFRLGGRLYFLLCGGGLEKGCRRPGGGID